MTGGPGALGSFDSLAVPLLAPLGRPLAGWENAEAMNGADNLTETLLATGIDTCFANPGTSEMHFVASLDRKPEMRCILGLFEGVVTGAADGFGRMADRPAATLLHTGPGLANGLANLHNAKRARSPIVNIVGDHASHHLAFDAPLTSDIDALAGTVSQWVHRVAGPEDIAPAAIEAHRVACSTPGIATLILPGDAAWTETPPVAARPARIARPTVSDERVREVAAALRQARGRCALVLSGPSAREAPLATAARIAAATGARLFGDMLIPRMERGSTRSPVERIPYPVDQAVEAFRHCDVLVLVGASEPVAFFAYPGKPSRLCRDDARVVVLASPGEDAAQALDALADELGASRTLPAAGRPALPAGRPTGPLTEDVISRILVQSLPEDAIVVDEALTSLQSFYAMAAGAPPHDYLMACTGGSIGAGPPLATGVAVACPGRKVLCLQADGSGMYTVQALWTQAREQLDVVTLVFANRAYAILQGEMRAVGVERFGRNAERMLSLDDPALDWVSLAAGLGVEGRRLESAEDLAATLARALAGRGPFLIEVVL